jgi:hypothetical protein
MIRRNRKLLLFASVFLAAIVSGAPVQPAKQKLRPVIRQVDHILIQASDPKFLFNFFADTLQLPVAWPIADYSSFASGGVSAGNVNLEVLRFADQKGSSPARRAGARFIGLAFEPYRMDDCLAALQARGIPYDPPEPYVSKLPDGSEGTLWTNVVLPRVSKPGLSVFLCEYSSAFLHAEIRRNQLGGQLALRKGGPLGVKSVKEIVLSATDPARDRSGWQKLLITSAGPSAMLWQVGNGPAIHLIPGSTDRIQRIVLKVDSLKPAKDFLAEKRLLGAASAQEISIDPSKIQGLSIRLVER